MYPGKIRLPELLVACAAESVDVRLLTEALDEFRTGLEATARDFAAAHAGLDVAVRSACGAAVIDVQARLGQCRSLVEMVSRALPAADAARLSVLGRNLQNGMRAVEVAFAAYREAGLRALGPTSLGSLNLLARTLADVEGGRTPYEVLARLLAGESSTVRAALARSGQPAQVVAALRDLLGVITPLLEADPATTPVDLARARADLLAASQRLEEASIAARLQEPTPVVRCNAIILQARAVMEGRAEMPDLEDEVQRFVGEMRDARARAALATREVPPDDSATALVRAALDLLERSEQAVEAVLATVQAGARTDFEGAIATLQVCMAPLYEVTQQLGRAAELEGRTPCIRCGALNPADRRTCHQCSAILPAAVQDTTHAVDMHDEGGGADVETVAGPVRMTENLQRTLQAVEEFARGDMSTAAFMEEVAWLETLVHQARRVVPAATASEDPAADAAATYHAGLEQFALTVAWLRRGATQGDISALEQGLAHMWEGAAHLQAAQRQAG